MQPNDFVEIVERAIRDALGPVVQRVAVLEANVGTYTKALERLQTTPPPAPLMVPVPGPPGPQGPAGEPGANGRDGVDGKDGSPGLKYCGVYQPGATYSVGDVVSYGGSAWHCHRETLSTPIEDARDWQLMVKRGRDRDLRDK